MSGLIIDPPATPLSANSPTFVYENPFPRDSPGAQAPVHPAANPQPTPVQPKAICTPSVTSAATRRTAPFTGKELFELVQAAIDQIRNGALGKSPAGSNRVAGRRKAVLSRSEVFGCIPFSALINKILLKSKFRRLQICSISYKISYNW